MRMILIRYKEKHGEISLFLFPKVSRDYFEFYVFF